MIIDTLDQLEKYAAINPNFAKACEFLKNTDLSKLDDGKHEIDGEKVFALAARSQGRPKSEALLEIHRKYIDIQVILSGYDEMGWKPTASLTEPKDDFSSESDCQLFEDQPDTWVKVLPGMFAVFFPHDAHAPLVGDCEIHKIVIKVLC